MDNFSTIANGWKNYAFPSAKMKELAKERAKICATCPHLKDTWLSLGKDLPKIKGKKCGKCGCPNLSAVVSSENKKCPDGRW